MITHTATRLFEAMLGFKTMMAAVAYNASKDEELRKKAVTAILNYIVPPGAQLSSAHIDEVLDQIGKAVGTVSRMYRHAYIDGIRMVADAEAGKRVPLPHVELKKNSGMLSTYLYGLREEALSLEWNFASVADYLQDRNVLDFGCGLFNSLALWHNANIQPARYFGYDRQEVVDAILDDESGKQLFPFTLDDRIVSDVGSTIPEGWDFEAVWLSNVLHTKGPKEQYTVLHRCAHRLKPGGKLAVVEVDPAGLYGTLFDLQMYSRTSEGGTVKPSDLEAKARACSFKIQDVQPISELHYVAVFERV
jgi:SAM-dependent methyltransferase